ncbi:hypothetical protein SAV14893_089220 [Streptomyces avermitilis]|uniref:Uncharacterized protein n=1 Tax=Streptomyces avermitilis TaxID=33903 RepID=A0A4D4MD37_STRAX|nr:hypothetical protein SAVMC3_07330 [Streptomyces avermitilis]GDY69529.1 hypothetical protein SAV14893_089220 [Streptomyces avermitilis]GDY79786.1 hypothetical protein SAV31267_092710 [Streptomyces avermitilis]
MSTAPTPGVLARGGGSQICPAEETLANPPCPLSRTDTGLIERGMETYGRRREAAHAPASPALPSVADAHGCRPDLRDAYWRAGGLAAHRDVAAAAVADRGCPPRGAPTGGPVEPPAGGDRSPLASSSRESVRQRLILMRPRCVSDAVPDGPKRSCFSTPGLPIEFPYVVWYY